MDYYLLTHKRVKEDIKNAKSVLELSGIITRCFYRNFPYSTASALQELADRSIIEYDFLTKTKKAYDSETDPVKKMKYGLAIVKIGANVPSDRMGNIIPNFYQPTFEHELNELKEQVREELTKRGGEFIKNIKSELNFEKRFSEASAEVEEAIKYYKDNLIQYGGKWNDKTTEILLGNKEYIDKREEWLNANGVYSYRGSGRVEATKKLTKKAKLKQELIAIEKKADMEALRALIKEKGLDEKKYLEGRSGNNEKLKKLITDIQNKILDQTTVSKEEAISWYKKSVNIDPSIKGEKELEKSILKFYRITKGKLKNVNIQGTGKDRSFCRTIKSGEEKSTFFLSKDHVVPQVIFHELAHLLDRTDVTYGSSEKDFILKRRTDDRLYKLSSIEKNSNYGKNEVAYKDTFIDPYVGKWYSNDFSSEVLSMGMQMLSADAHSSLAIKFLNDTEHFNLVVGICLDQKVDEMIELPKLPREWY